jgi:hypothetical protein
LYENFFEGKVVANDELNKSDQKTFQTKVVGIDKGYIKVKNKNPTKSQTKALDFFWSKKNHLYFGHP